MLEIILQLLLSLLDYYNSHAIIFHHSRTDRCEFCYCSICLREWLCKCQTKFLAWKEGGHNAQSLFRSSGINALSTLFAIACSVLTEKWRHCNLLCLLIKTYCTKPLGIVQGSISAFFPLLENSVYNFLSVEKVLCHSSKPVHRSFFFWSYTLFLHFDLLWPVLVWLLIQQLFSTSLVAGELTSHLVSKQRIQTVWNAANEKDTFKQKPTYLVCNYLFLSQSSLKKFVKAPVEAQYCTGKHYLLKLHIILHQQGGKRHYLENGLQVVEGNSTIKTEVHELLNPAAGFGPCGSLPHCCQWRLWNQTMLPKNEVSTGE